MDAISADYADRGVQSYFLYVREAHPGENDPHHASLDDKVARAREFRDLFNAARWILVDDFEGSVHRGCGMLPNMTYILSASQTVVYRSDWTEPETVRWTLDYLLNVRSRRRGGPRLAPFYAEIQGFHSVDRRAFDAGLERNGPRSLSEYQQAVELWSRGDHLGSVLPGLRSSKRERPT